MSANGLVNRKNVVKEKYERAVEKILETMESSGEEWVKSWSCGKYGMPMNESTLARYRGINVLLLFSNTLEFGYRSNRYVTYKQAKSLGANVKKGEQGAPIFFFTIAESKELNDEGKKTKYPMMKCFTVFNIDQLEGVEFEFEKVQTFKNERNEKIENWVKNLDVEIRYEGFQPFFSPGSNFVQMTPLEYFHDSDNYYSTLFHELAHATGHESRLNRDMSQDKKSYGFEELVAELSSVFTCGEFGVNIEKCQHVEYLAGWIRIIREDKKVLWKAASQAQKATDYLVRKEV